MAENSVAILQAGSWDRFFKKVDSTLKNPVQVLSAAYGTRGYRDIIDHFEKEEGPNGKWASRSDATQRSYASRQRSDAKYSPFNKILQLSGDTRKSITPTSYKKEGRDAIKVFAGTNYSGQHDRGEGGLPQRSFMWLSKSALQDMAKIILGLLTKDGN